MTRERLKDISTAEKRYLKVLVMVNRGIEKILKEFLK